MKEVNFATSTEKLSYQVLDWQPMLSDYRSFPAIIRVVTMPGLFNVRKSAKILNLGGVGDCFFMALNAAMISYEIHKHNQAWCYDSSSTYSRLGLKDLTYIEDQHIQDIAGNYPFSIVVHRTFKKRIFSTKFGSAPDECHLYNDYPSHYMLFSELKIAGEWVDVRSVAYKTVDIERSEMEIQSNYPKVGDTGIVFDDDPDKCYTTSLDLTYLFNYVDTRYTIRKLGKTLRAADSKIYYKLRHNLFQTTFLSLLGLTSHEELPFSHYGIDSIRTPDLLIQHEGGLVLIEFTVVKRYLTSIRTKQSRNKYGVEVSLAESMGMKIAQFYPTLSLDENTSSLVFDIESIAKLLGLSIYQDPAIVFTDLQNNINELEFNMSELMPELLLNQEEHSAIEFKSAMEILSAPNDFRVVIEKVGLKRLRDQNTYNLILKNARSIERQLKRTLFSAKFILIVNMRFNRIYPDVDSKGIPKAKLLNLIQSNSYKLLDHVEYIGDQVSDSEPFKVLGNPSFNPSDERQQKVTRKVLVDEFESYYSSKLYKGAKQKLMNTLVDHKLIDQVGLVEETYCKKLAALRGNSRTVDYEKNWFLFPCCTELKKGPYKGIKLETGKTLSDRLIRTCRPVEQEKVIDRNQDLRGLDTNLVEVNKAYQKLLTSINFDRKLTRKLKHCKTVDEVPEVENMVNKCEIQENLNAYKETKRKMVKEVGEPTRLAYRNRVTMTKSYMKTYWEPEMEHFQSNKSLIKICPQKDMQDLQLKIDSLLEKLWSFRSEGTTDDIYSETVPQGLKLKETLTDMKETVDPVSSEFRMTQICHDLEFLSRAAYSITYYSNIKSNSNDFFYDNLGYADALLLVKGGKKILSNKRSRLFKLIFKIDDKFGWIFNAVTTQRIKVGNSVYCVLPWQTWSFPMLKKASELYYSFSNYYCCSYLESGLDLDTFRSFISSKVLNMFSQRRKVEIWFGFFRYLYLNSMSEYTNVIELIDDMVDFDYDPYFYYCQRKFSSSYQYINKWSSEGKIYDMVTGTVVDNFDLCAEKFDECLFMTMAPFDRVNEHLRNLRSVLTMHAEVVSNLPMDPNELLKKTGVDAYRDDYFQSLDKNDLMFDPKLCFCVGKFASDYLTKIVSVTHLSDEFSKIVECSFTDISTSKGMRQSDGEFWGKKGHDVIFSDRPTFEMLKGFVESLPNSNSEYRKKISETNVSFREKIKMLSRLVLEFDLKDKAQWKGSREIYVMSDTTKILQNPLERFFKILCSYTPNELIHKKSHVRPKLIHSQMFEFEDPDLVSTFATLDCRKWAPKSNLWKYYYFVRGMAPALPPEFVEYFYCVWSLMFSKKVRIQKIYVEMLKKNPETVALIDHLQERDDGDYEFVMPYSFMMGIFNYLSSLMHAFSQLYFDDKIARKQGAHFNLIAHSDDSGGVIFSKSKERNYFLFRQYEMFQKGLNHLMSKKKCSLSSNFFEMISIMYANKRLIPMTHKFLSNTSFEPKGKGWVDDISTVVSKVVELFSNGGTLLQCYLTMLSMTEMIRKFYHLPRVKTLSSIPLAYGGLFNLHPIHMILLGADCQEIMLDVVESPGERNFRVNAGLAMFGEYFPGKGTSAKYHIPYYKQHELTGQFTDDQMDLLKLVSGVASRTTLGQSSGHYSRLRDPAYVYSLEGVDMCQIYTMTLFTKTLVLNAEGTKKCDLRKLTARYAVLKALKLFSGKVDIPRSNFHHYMKSSEGIKINFKKICVPSKKTCKPVSYSTFQPLGMGLTFQDVNELIAYMKEPRLHFMFPDRERMETLKRWVKLNLGYNDDFVLEDYLMKITSKEMDKIRSTYCFIPANVNIDTVERFWTYINMYCTRRYLLSSDKPQYFTVDQFRLWQSDYDYLKHTYLLLKVALRCPVKDEVFDRLRENTDCPKCSYKKEMKNIVDEVQRIRKLGDREFFTTNLPFCVYLEEQRRAVNVWFGKAEAVLYTQFGTVSITKRLGEIYHVYDVISTEVVDQLRYLVMNFQSTRGLMDLSIVYSVNDTPDFKLGFDDLRQARVVYPGERAMIQTNTLVRVSEVSNSRLFKEDGKYTFDGHTVDFEIYQNYDINEGFYRSHNLSQIANLIFEDEAETTEENVRRFSLNTKLYKVLNSDPSFGHTANMESNYSSCGLLGSERSLTRALVLATNKGLTSYRSNINPGVLETSVLEGSSHRDVPLIDLVDQFSFARVTYRERMVMMRAVNEKSVREKDLKILDGLTAKMGLKPTLNAITTVRSIFTSLIYTDIKNLSTPIADDYMYITVKSAINSITDSCKEPPEYCIQGTRQQVYKLIALLIKMKSSSEIASELITKLAYRAQHSNAGKYWELRRSSMYAALVVPDRKHFRNQQLFNMGILNRLGKDWAFKISQIRQVKIALRDISSQTSTIVESVFDRREEGTEYLTIRLPLDELPTGNYKIEDDDDVREEAYDMIEGGDPLEETLDRVWNGDETLVSYVFNDKDMRCLAEDTLPYEFESVTIISPCSIRYPPWLGPSDISIQNISNLPLYVCKFPGRITKQSCIRDVCEEHIERIESKPLEVLPSPESNKVTHPTKVGKEIFSLETDEEVYQYQYDVLKGIGITNPARFAGNFFKKSDISDKNSFWNNFFTGMNLRAINKINNLSTIRGVRSNVLPGFTGNLNDKDIKAELNAMFEGHAEEIITGNQCLAAKSHKALVRSFRRIYHRTNDRFTKGYVLILLSTMRDCVITERSDNWYSDCLLGAIDNLEEDEIISEQDTSAPAPAEGIVRQYRIVNPFER
ncbi:RNA-dependent RNA polymerase [Phytophthora condilina negative stranded RNA virus 5]|nr:RNA-dependent RNA polymerase [Phytophthora condilina negative stranded RNA virus 5]